MLFPSQIRFTRGHEDDLTAFARKSTLLLWRACALVLPLPAADLAKGLKPVDCLQDKALSPYHSCNKSLAKAG